MKENKKKRKYTKHDYIADLNKKARFWTSISKSENYGLSQGIINHPISKFTESKEEVELYLQDFAKKYSQFLGVSSELQSAYSALQDILSLSEKFQREKVGRLFQNSWKLTNFRFENYLTYVELLNQEHEIQRKRIRDIQAYIAYTQKQIDLEKGRLENKNEDKNSASLMERLFSSANSVILKFSNPRYRFLKRVKKKEEKEIKSIELDLQKKAKAILQNAEKDFTPENQKVLIKSLKEIKKILKEGELLTGYLKSRLFNIRRTVETVLKERKKAPVSCVQNNEKSPEEKIQYAFKDALTENKNLILVGKYRSLGLTNAVIKDIMDDENFQKDIIEHIYGLLSTSQDKNFEKSGNSRWKPVQSSSGLYELSVNPKSGHSQKMPRLYAKREIFIQKEDSIVITNNQKQGKTDLVWVLVRKGSKGSQENDMNLSEKVYFENDGKSHYGSISVNNLEWKRIEIDSKKTNLPQKSSLRKAGRE